MKNLFTNDLGIISEIAKTMKTDVSEFSDISENIDTQKRHINIRSTNPATIALLDSFLLKCNIIAEKDPMSLVIKY